MDFVYFLGRFHVLLLHLPIGILLLAVVLEVASRRERLHYLAPALGAVWLFGAISAIGTAALGYLHASEGGFDSAAVNAHRIAGTSLAVLATAIWVLRAKFAEVYDRSWLGWSLIVVALLVPHGALRRQPHSRRHVSGAVRTGAAAPSHGPVRRAYAAPEAEGRGDRGRLSRCGGAGVRAALQHLSQRQQAQGRPVDGEL